MTENPWDVDSIQAFSFLKCPECIFDTKEEEIFQEHAVENHPLSFVLFGKADLKEEDEDFYENLETEEIRDNGRFVCGVFKQGCRTQGGRGATFAEISTKFLQNRGFCLKFFLFAPLPTLDLGPPLVDKFQQPC